jgi:Poly A polymerase regulatory subunit
MFRKEDELLKENDNEEPYRRRKDDEKKALAYGQRKLLMSLISFLSKHYNSKEVSKPVLVYAGAAPGVNIKIVASLFPEFTWHLYDPAKFKIKMDITKKIIVYQKKFDNETAKYWAKQNQKNKNVFFVSDIRTADYTKAKDLNENESQILEDMRLQKEWVEIIKPIKTQLKFRLPYPGGSRPNEIEYFTGILYRQVFAPQTSTETRLVLTSPEFKYQTYSCEKYQSQMFYHNVIVRETFEYENDFVDGKELVNDWDSCCEVLIWLDYLKNRKKDISKKKVLELSENATKLLTKGRKYQDTLSYLRANPRAIKDRNFNN